MGGGVMLPAFPAQTMCVYIYIYIYSTHHSDLSTVVQVMLSLAALFLTGICLPIDALFLDLPAPRTIVGCTGGLADGVESFVCSSFGVLIEPDVALPVADATGLDVHPPTCTIPLLRQFRSCFLAGVLVFNLFVTSRA